MGEKMPTPPGQVLLEQFLQPNNIQQKTLAEHLGWTKARLNEIINVKRGITADSALSLACAFDTTAEFWLDLQRDWDIYKAKKSHTIVTRIV
ncbi:MAG: HigA family addiction module antitoxin [Francisellaceae bacterium]